MKNDLLKSPHPHKPHALDHRTRDYILTMRIGGLTRKVVWNDQKILLLDHPQGWTIAKVNDEICIYDNSDPDFDRRSANMIAIPENEKNKTTLELPPSFNQARSRAMRFTITPLEPIQPPYKQVIYDIPGQVPVPRQLLMYQGVRHFLLKYRPVGSKLTAKAGTRQIFKYEKTREGYCITSLTSDLQVKRNGKKEFLPIGIPFLMNESDFFAASFIRGINWWRFRSVVTPDALPPLEEDETEEDARDASRFNFAYRSVVATLCLLFCASLAYNYLYPAPPKQIVTKIELKAPKVIPHKEIAEVKPTPEPTPAPPKEEKKKEVVKEKPKPALEKKVVKNQEKPKKVVKKEPPKPKPVVKKETPKPKKVAKKEPPKVEKPKPAPVQKVAKEEPVQPKHDKLPPPVKKSLQEAPPKAGVVAKKTEAPPAPPDESAQLAKSLSFLSSGAKSPAKGGLAKYDKNHKKEFMNAPSLGGSTKDSAALDNISSASTDTNIKTRSSRSIANDTGIDAPQGKGLNDVQGKVSLTQLYAAGGSSEGFEEGTAISLSGPGSLSEDQIEKALAKYLSRFQFCYEKALLTDSSLAGNIRLQWTIETNGKAADTKVLNSQMKNAGLHSCILKVLKEVPFPHPKGGPVTAKKIFSFKSSAL